MSEVTDQITHPGLWDGFLPSAGQGVEEVPLQTMQQAQPAHRYKRVEDGKPAYCTEVAFKDDIDMEVENLVMEVVDENGDVEVLEIKSDEEVQQFAFSN